MENNMNKRSAAERFIPLVLNTTITVGLNAAGNKLTDKAFEKAFQEKKYFQSALLATAGQILTSTAWLSGLLLPFTVANACVSKLESTSNIEDLKEVEIIEE